MTDARVTQDAVKVLSDLGPEGRVSSASASVLTEAAREARVSQEAVSALALRDPAARVTQAGVAVLHRNKPARGPFRQVTASISMSSSRGIAGDPYFSYVSLLMTSRTGARDVSKYGHFITGDRRVGPLVREVTPGQRVLYQANTSEIGNSVERDLCPQVANVPLAFHLGRRKFTIEAWVRPLKNSVGVLGCYDTTGNDRGWALLTGGSGELLFYGSVNNLAADITLTGPVIPKDRMTHVAVDRDDDGKFRMYVNGVMVASLQSYDAIRQSSAPLTVLGYNRTVATNYYGHIDDLRLTVGVARYASDTGFTPPAKVAVPNVDPIDRENDPYWDLVAFATNARTVPISDLSKHAAPMREYSTRHDGYLMCGEYWPGWTSTSPVFEIDGPDGRFDLSSGEFTFEVTNVWRSTASNTGVLLHIENQCRVLRTGYYWYFQVWNGSQWLSAISFPPGSALRFGNHDHCAITRDGQGVYRFYINGKLMAKGAGYVIPYAENPKLILNLTDSSMVLIDMRLTVGKARWTSDLGIPAEDAANPWPLQGPVYVPEPTPEPVFPASLNVLNPKARQEPGAEWNAVSGGAIGRFNKYTQTAGIEGAPDEFWFYNSGTGARAFHTSRVEVPPEYLDLINDGLVDLVYRLDYGFNPQDAYSNGCVLVRTYDSGGARRVHAAGPNRRGTGWIKEEVRFPLPPETVSVEVGFFTYASGSWSPMNATDLEVTLVRRSDPAVYVASPSYGLVPSEWVAKSGTLVTQTIYFGLTGMGQQQPQAEYYFPADLPAGLIPEIDAGACSFTFNWLGLIGTTDASDGGRIWLEFIDGADELVGVRRYDRRASYLQPTGGGRGTMTVRVPAGARKVRMGVRCQRSKSEAATSWTDFYVTGFSGYLEVPDELPPEPSVPMPETDDHWPNVRCLLSSRNGLIEDLSRNPVVCTAYGSAAVVPDVGPFPDGNAFAFNVAAQLNNNHYVEVLMDGAPISGPFTFEAWVRKTDDTTRAYNGLGTGAFGMGDNATSPLYMYSTNVYADASMSYDEWMHVAVCRDEDNTIFMFVNGVRQAQEHNSAAHWPISWALGRGGTSTNYASWVGYVDEVRLTEGVVRYREDFIPQGNRFPTRGGEHRYWRAVFPSIHGANYIALSEVELRQVRGVAEPVAGTVSVSGSWGGGFGGPEAVDGNSGTYWYGTQDGTGTWWLAVDYGDEGAVAISEVWVKTSMSASYGMLGPSELILEWSDDGETWVTAFSASGIPAWTTGQERAFSEV